MKTRKFYLVNKDKSRALSIEVPEVKGEPVYKPSRKDFTAVSAEDFAAVEAGISAANDKVLADEAQFAADYDAAASDAVSAAVSSGDMAAYHKAISERPKMRKRRS